MNATPLGHLPPHEADASACPRCEGTAWSPSACQCSPWALPWWRKHRCCRDSPVVSPSVLSDGDTRRRGHAAACPRLLDGELERESLCWSGVEAVSAVRRRRPRRALASAAGTAVGASCLPPRSLSPGAAALSEPRPDLLPEAAVSHPGDQPSWRSAAERRRWLTLPLRPGARSPPWSRPRCLPDTRRVVSILLLSVDQPAASRPLPAGPLAAGLVLAHGRLGKSERVPAHAAVPHELAAPLPLSERP